MAEGGLVLSGTIVGVQGDRQRVQPVEVRQQLARILSSQGFSRAESLRTFLNFAVERSLTDAGEKMNEYLVGLEVFGRPPSYDPRIDPIVRVQARKLRQRLATYYDGPGSLDPILIEIPSGGYSARFQRRGADSSEPATAAPSERVAPCVAILPFANLAGDPSQDYLCDGVAEELINALARLNGLRVVARTSSFCFRGDNLPAQRIGHALDAHYLLEGALGLWDRRLRVTARLIDTSTGHPVWADAFEHRFDDVFLVQQGIAQAIVGTLEVELEGREPQRLARPDTENLASYQACLQAWRYWNLWTEEGVQKGLQAFEEAIRLDPGNTSAQVGLSFALAILANFGAAPPQSFSPRARQAAEAALLADEDLGEAHCAWGTWQAIFDFDWAGSEKAFLQGLDLSPGFVPGRRGYAMACLVPLRRFDEAITQMEHARDLDPLSCTTTTDLGGVYFFASRFTEALEWTEAALKLEPTSQFAINNRAWIHYRLGRLDEAVRDSEAACAIEANPVVVGLLGRISAQKHPERARRCLEQLDAMSATRYVSPLTYAMVYIGLQEPERALASLEQCYKKRTPLLRYANSDSGWSLGDYPPFLEFLERIGLPVAEP